MMLRPHIRFVFAGLLAALPAASALADRIELSDGRVLEGQVERSFRDPELGDVITIVLPGGRITLPAAQLRSVSESTHDVRLLIEARGALRDGRYAEAIMTMHELVSSPSGPAAIAALLERYGQRMAPRVDAMGPDQHAALSRLLQAAAQADNSRSQDALLARVWLHVALGEREAASALLELLRDVLATDDQTRTDLAAWINERIDRLQERGEHEQARDLLELLAPVDPQLASGRRVQFYLTWARSHREAGRYEEALHIYQEMVAPGQPQIAAEFIRRTLAEADQAWELTGRERDLIHLYQTYGLPNLEGTSRQRLVQIWRNIGWRSLRRGEYEDARAAFMQANQFEPGSADADLARVEYRRRRAELADGDLIGHYELGVWAVNNQLDDEALEQFVRASYSPIVGDNARQYILQIRNRQAERELLALMDLYDAREYKRVLEGLHAFRRKGYVAAFQRQADDLERLTLDAMQIALAERPQQAEALLQQAERDFYLDRLDDAQAKLQAIFDHYPRTEAYPRARNLLARVRQKRLLQQVESGDTPTLSPADQDLITTRSEQVVPGQVDMGGEIDELYQSLQRLHAR